MIEIEKQINETTKEVFRFNLFDLTAVLVYWSIQEKPKGKRKFSIIDYWDRYDRRYRTKPEPNLPDQIRAEALIKLMALVRVKTWDEWKGFTSI